MKYLTMVLLAIYLICMNPLPALYGKSQRRTINESSHNRKTSFLPLFVCVVRGCSALNKCPSDADQLRTLKSLLAYTEPLPAETG